MTTTERLYPGAATSEGAQELAARGASTAGELLREQGSVLRLSEASAAELAERAGSEDETMIINMGP
ncbi:MAG: hypothetical protein KY450_11540, partial [Actinobacteria bacterium]|nr:hypothetical protein [Actinomycetota bacterium]